MIQEPTAMSIVIPVYNRGDVVKRTLDSVYSQTYRPIRLIVVDNNSNDNSLEVLKTWAEENSAPDFEVQVLECRTPGAAAARNAGMDIVDTEWMMFFDSDDTMRPNHVSRTMEALKRTGADIVGWDVNYHQLNGREVVKPFEDKDLVFHCVMHGTFATQRYAARTSIFHRAGGWNETVSTWDDIELGVRIICRIPELRVMKAHEALTVDVYESEESLSGPTYHSRANEAEYALECIAKNLPERDKNVINLKRVILAANYTKEGYKADGLRLKQIALQNTSPLQGALLKFAYHYCRMGGRGAARIVYPILRRT